MKSETPIAHTPTPWKVNFEDNRIEVEWDGAHVTLVATQIPRWHENHRKGVEEAEANAAFIVRAVNAHEGLLTALKSEHYTPDIPGHETETCGTCAVIAKAESGATCRECGEAFAPGIKVHAYHAAEAVKKWVENR